MRNRYAGVVRIHTPVAQVDEGLFHRFAAAFDESIALNDLGGHGVPIKRVAGEALGPDAFGQVFAFSKGGDASGVSIPIRGPVTVQSAFSKEPVSVTSTQITKSVSGEGDRSKRGADTMGMKHRVDLGIYECYGSINPQLAVKTEFNDADTEVINALLPKLFENDASSARPDGSMEVLKVIWWKHNCKAGQYSSAKVHGSLTVNPDGSIALANLAGLLPEVIDGF